MSQPLFARDTGPPVRVALPLPIDSLFDYAVPEALGQEVEPGRRVLVSFSGRRLTGVVVERAPDPDGTGLASIEQVLDAEPVISPSMLTLLREAAEAVLCPLGVALATALPAGSAPRIIRHLSLTTRGREALRSGAVRGDTRALLEELERRPATRAALEGRLARGRPLALALERDGLLAWKGSLRGPTAREQWIRVAAIADGVDVERECQGSLARAPRQAELLRKIASAGELPTAALRSDRRGSPPALRELVRRELVRVERRLAPRNIFSREAPEDTVVALTPDQAAAIAPIGDAIAAERPATFLLHGVTGSGKTEVYLRAVEAALARGRQALVLVPEITLTHQIVARLRARFGDALAVLHSGLRPGERLEQWQRLRRGATPIAVGARSALFAPLERLGVIVIDEEHDSAYKNEEGFRYCAHDLASRRAALASCPVVLGSATPGLETRYAAERGEIERLVLPRRIGGRPLPAVEIADLRRERAMAPRGRKLIVSRPLQQALSQTLADGGQAILLLNRRGFSTRIFCFDCGHAERCENCDVSLVYHASEQRLRCHYCDFSKEPPDACGGCGVPDTALLGVGTERLEEEVRKLLPDARIARLDGDTARRRGFTESVLHSLREGHLDVLLGTQIVAKGHDFPGVRLVGVIAADLGLHLPDFRAAERCFQLLTQVAGRAGRAGVPGRVLIQTFSPDHYAIRPVREHDYERFYADEIAHRASLGYPPLGSLAQLMVSAEQESTARDAIRRLAEVVNTASPTGAAGAAAAAFEVLGPAPAALPRLRGRYRFQLLVKGSDARRVHAAARALRDGAARLPKGVHASVDVNPVNML